MPPRNLLTIALAAALCFASSTFAARTLPGRRFNEVVSVIQGSHLDPAPTTSLVDAAIEAAVGRLDEHSEYLRGFRREAVETALDQEFVGVGLELEWDEATREPVVVAAMPRGPAWQAGVTSGTRIIAIDGMPTHGVPLAEVVVRLRGPRGTSAMLEVRDPVVPHSLDPLVAPPTGTTRVVPIVRDLVRMESVLGDRRMADGSWLWRLSDAPDVALVRIIGFGEHTAAEFRTALESLARDDDTDRPPLRGLVLDLRDNPGGLLTAAVEVCDHLLEQGVIVTTRSRDGGSAPQARHATAGGWRADVPIVVLVDGLTSSAAEIVAACLQDHRRAVVAGSRTYGKGTVQSILPLAGGEGLLKLTTAEYLRPSGGRLHRGSHDGDDAPWGVIPDAGLECAPTRAALDRLRAWRRRSDTAISADRTTGPCAIDDVLARAVARLQDPGHDD